MLKETETIVFFVTFLLFVAFQLEAGAGPLDSPWLRLWLMPNKMISFPYEIKITHSVFCYYMVFTILLKTDKVEAPFILFFYFYYYDIRTHGVA